MVFLFVAATHARPAISGEPAGPLGLAMPTERHTGDLEGMVERRTIRVLTVYSETIFFFDNGTPRGIAFDALTAFGAELNRELRTGDRPIGMEFIPVDRDNLVPALADGRGDVVAGYLTITPEAEKLVDFTDPLLTGIRQIAVTGPGGPRISTVDDLAGRTIFVRKSTSYWTNLLALNEKFRDEGRRPVTLKPAPEELEDEDLLEMVNAGLLPIVIVDSHVAQFWQQLLPGVRVHQNVIVHAGGEIAWAIRKDSPRLRGYLNDFIRTHGVDTLFGAVTLRRYLRSDWVVRNATNPAELRKFRTLIKYFRKYGDQYDLDWILMAAQGYQESGLNQNARSGVGAIGVMQVMPATGKSLDVGNIHFVEPNIHAGVKYVRQIIDQNYKSEPMDALNRTLFAFAAYNAGPATIESLRQEAARRGMNSNVWFNSVERIAAERIGRQTVTYVRNIYRYYIAYELAEEEGAERQRALRELERSRSRHTPTHASPTERPT